MTLSQGRCVEVVIVALSSTLHGYSRLLMNRARIHCSPGRAGMSVHPDGAEMRNPWSGNLWVSWAKVVAAKIASTPSEARGERIARECIRPIASLV
jgi:hypothetical protein